jgi:hypothetical protein
MMARDRSKLISIPLYLLPAPELFKGNHLPRLAHSVALRDGIIFDVEWT